MVQEIIPPIHPKKSLAKFYLVLFIFIFPMFISALLYYFHDFFHFKTVNKGHLISPPLSVNNLFFTPPSLRTNHWYIIHVDNGHCDMQCEKTNYELNQIRKVLDKEHTRLFVISLTGNTSMIKELQQKLNLKNIDSTAGKEYKKNQPSANKFNQTQTQDTIQHSNDWDNEKFTFTTTHLPTDKSSTKAVVGTSIVATNKIYLMDPLGNLFMYYDDTISPMFILKDLKRVLEVSQIG